MQTIRIKTPSKDDSPQKVRKSALTKRLVNVTLKVIDFKIVNSVCAKYHGILKNKEWTFRNLDFNEYKNNEMAYLIALCEKIQIESLTIHFSRRSRVLKQLSISTFPNLITLNIPGNNITSLQPLTRMNLASLKRLYVRQNFITNLKPLKKAIYKLEVLQLSDNRIVSFEDFWSFLDLSQMKQLMAYNNSHMALDYQFVKSTLIYPKIQRLFLTECPQQEKFIRFLLFAGAQNVRFI